MNYKQTLDYLFSQLPMFQRVGPAAYKADLNNTITICKLLDNPEKSFPAIHVAGTNGKGSVSHMIASVLQEAGYKTGLYTSPHLKDFRERIKVNGKMIPEKFVTAFVENNLEKFSDLHPSFFEYTFALCMSYFATEKIDLAVVEVGMGGRLDSTNVIHPVLSVITNIGLDHTRFLGDTHAKIALEKGGIIKQGIPVVIGETQDITAGVFTQLAEEKSSRIIFADQLYSTKISDHDKFLMVDLVPVEPKNNFPAFYDLQSALSGHYQLKNITTAVVSLLFLKETLYLEINQIYAGIKNVIKNTGILGRWQTLRKQPRVICDTGHNEEGLKHIVKQLENLEYNRLHFVLGLVNDKDVGNILALLPNFATYYFCKADIPRGLNQDELMLAAWQKGLKGKSYPSVKIALEAAKQIARTDDLIFVGGSTFVVAEVL